MAESYLTLTNKVLVKLNEVELTSSNFSSARGVQTQAKNAVNEAIRYINQREFNYPFNHSTKSETLVPGTVRYTIPTTAKSVDYNTFRIVKDTDTNTAGGRLRKLDYNEYVNAYITQEDEIVTTTLNGSHSSSVTTLTLTSTTGFDATGKVYIESEIITYTGILGNDLTGCTRGAESTTAAEHASGVQVAQFDSGSAPINVVRTLDNNYLLYPYPEKEYTLKYDFFTFPSDLSAHGDTTTIPDRFAPVIVDGAVSFVYQYRGETQQYGIAFARFEQGIKNMQTLLVNKFEYVRSTYIPYTGNSRGSSNVRAE
mgnify:CR=1 FL=1|tara:strand:- start:453 stop:1388 length:936 start_codon:yes stop_codon:yes gene_type:complete